MSIDIVSGPDWDFRLYKNGRFCLRYNKVSDDLPDGIAQSCNQVSGLTLAELFGSLLHRASDKQLVEFRAVFVAAANSGFSAEAVALQRRYSHAQSVIASASLPAKLAASKALVLQGGDL